MRYCALGFRRSGYSLLETIISCFLICVTVLGLFELFPGSLLAMKRASCTIQAGNVAEAALEGARAQGFSRLGNTAETRPATVIEGIAYACTLEVFDIPDTDPALLKGIRASVHWGFRGHDHVLVRESWMCYVKS